MKYSYASLISMLLLTAPSVSLAQADSREARWQEALLVQAERVSARNKRTAQSCAIISLTEIGRDAEAKSLLAIEPSEEIRNSLLFELATGQARSLRFDDAFMTINELPDEYQERAKHFVAIELAKAGQLDRAVACLKPMKDAYNSDRVRAAIASRLAKDSRFDAADLQVAAIEDEYRRREARERVERTRSDDLLPVEKLKGSLRGQVNALTAFSSKGTYDDAVSAIVAAQAGEREKAIRFASRALAEAKQPDLPPRDVTTAILAAVVFVELDDSASAKEIVQKIYEHSCRRGMALTTFFGKPILMGLMVRLEHFEAIKEILESEREANIGDSDLPYLYTLTAASQALVEFKHFQRFETNLENLETADEKFYWLMGGLAGLEQSGRQE